MPAPELIVAPLTPFTPDLAVDEPALCAEIDYVVGAGGATMVVAAGVETQEYTYLSLEQRKALIRRTIEFVDRRVPVMVGISHPAFKTAVELAQEAERLGAAAVQVLAPLRPFAGPPTQADLLAYFSAIARETTLPITLYLNPGPGADVSIPDTVALAQLPGVQLPHCAAPCSRNASCSASSAPRSRAASDKPSTVRTIRPSTWQIGTRQASTTWPSRITEQAPHSPSPQPSFVPVSPRSSRSTSRRRRMPGTSTSAGAPLTRKR